MLGLRTSDGINLLHLLALSRAAAEEAEQHDKGDVAADDAETVLQQPTATLQELLRCSAAFAERKRRKAAAQTAASAEELNDGAGTLFLLQQVLPAVLEGAAGFLRRPGIADVRVSIHPINSGSDDENNPTKSKSSYNEDAGEKLLQELRSAGLEMEEVRADKAWRLALGANETDTVSVSRVLRLLHAVEQHSITVRRASRPVVRCRLVLLDPDGLLLSDAVTRNIFVRLDKACQPLQGLLQDPA